jgi:hypothetical protein
MLSITGALFYEEPPFTPSRIRPAGKDVSRGHIDIQKRGVIDGVR